MPGRAPIQDDLLVKLIEEFKEDISNRVCQMEERVERVECRANESIGRLDERLSKIVPIDTYLGRMSRKIVYAILIAIGAYIVSNIDNIYHLLRWSEETIPQETFYKDGADVNRTFPGLEPIEGRGEDQ